MKPKERISNIAEQEKIRKHFDYAPIPNQQQGDRQLGRGREGSEKGVGMGRGRKGREKGMGRGRKGREKEKGRGRKGMGMGE